MNTTKFTAAAALAAALLSTGVFAQSVTQAPAPVAAPVPNEVIYLPQLPTAADLIAATGAGHGVTIQKIDQTSTQITVVYRFDSGQTNTVCYNLIAAAGAGMTPAAAVGAVPTPTTPAPNVAYGPGAPYYYSEAPANGYYPANDYYPAYGYYPAWYPPVVLGLGFDWGFRGGWGYHGGGGFRGGGHWH
jgi:hypothetical protein